MSTTDTTYTTPDEVAPAPWRAPASPTTCCRGRPGCPAQGSGPRRHEPPAAGRAWSAAGIIPRSRMKGDNDMRKTIITAALAAADPALDEVGGVEVPRNGACRAACRHRGRLLDRAS